MEESGCGEGTMVMAHGHAKSCNDKAKMQRVDGFHIFFQPIEETSMTSSRSTTLVLSSADITAE